MRLPEEVAAEHALRRCELLEPLSDAQIDALAATAALRTLRDGEPLFMKGEESHHLFVVERGQLSIHLKSPSGDEIGWAVSGPLTLLGWSAFFTPPVYVADARAIGDDTAVVVVDVAEAEEVMLSDPVVAYNVMKRIAGEISRRLRDLREQFVEAMAQR